MIICLEQSADDMCMVQLMPLPPHHLSLHLNSDWFTFLVPAYTMCVYYVCANVPFQKLLTYSVCCVVL